MSLPSEFTVYGSEEMLKPLILQLLAQYYGGGGEDSGGGGSYQRLPSYVKGHCLITLRFNGRRQSGTIHKIEKSFRWVKVDPQTVTLETIIQFANLIKTKFDNLTFVSGHSSYCYNHPEQGFNTVFSYFNSQADAMRLFEQLLDLQGFSPDWKRLTCSTVVQPEDRFLEPGEIVSQAGHRIRVHPERPIVTMSFHSAWIKFPHINAPILLVKFTGQLGDIASVLTNLSVGDQ